MAQFDCSNIIWHDIKEFKCLDRKVEYWINDSESLTRKIKNNFKNFNLKVLKFEKSEIYNHEKDKLSLEVEHIVREVIIYGDSKPIVFARSVIPDSQVFSNLVRIGEKPLGEVLFNDQEITRTLIEVTFHNNIWGRRSIFTKNNNPLLVSEFFLDEIYA